MAIFKKRFNSGSTRQQPRPVAGEFVPGTMQDWPLTVDKILDHAKLNHGGREVLSAKPGGRLERTTYADIHRRAKQVSRALIAGGVRRGDRVATMAWNDASHLETWYGAMGIGAVLHTLNPRLHPDQLAWIINHAKDRILVFDAAFAPIIEAIRPKIKTVKKFVSYGAVAQSKLKAVEYEAWIDGKDTGVTWGGFPETSACGLCYTSGTTGNPKGVAYSHRSNVLHSWMSCLPDAMGISGHDTILPIVPMFHANSWGLAFSGPMIGAKLVFPGPNLDGQSVYNLLNSEKVTASAAVPTVWLGLLQHLEAIDGELPHLNRVMIGGSALPERILRVFEERYEVEVIHAWGMTETSPMGTVNRIPPALDHLEGDDLIGYKLKQGRPPFGVEIKTVGEDGGTLPRDGKTSGGLFVRGAAVTAEYFQLDKDVLDFEGYLDTGDVANIDEHGTLQLTDRAKDVIKSGGEWISSVDIENIALSHPMVANAAAIGIYHPKWDERPLLIIEPKAGTEPTKDDILAHLVGKIAKWWMPDDVVFVDSIPLGATGKVNKLALREKFKDYKLPTA